MIRADLREMLQGCTFSVCPFCNSVRGIEVRQELLKYACGEPQEESGRWHIGCYSRGCGYELRPEPTLEALAKKWNARRG